MTKNSFVADVTFKGLSFLHLEIISLFAKLCYTSEEKSFFFCHHNLMKKVILSCLNMNLSVCVSEVGVLSRLS